MEFFDKERFALPASLDSMNAQEEVLTVQYTKEQVEQMEEFDMEGDAENDSAVDAAEEM